MNHQPTKKAQHQKELHHIQSQLMKYEEDNKLQSEVITKVEQHTTKLDYSCIGNYRDSHSNEPQVPGRGTPKRDHLEGRVDSHTLSINQAHTKGTTIRGQGS